MHPSARRFIASAVADHPPHGRVLECGSLNVNGGVRELFDGCWYTGIDYREGLGVDLIATCHALPFPDASFAWVVCSSMLEHDERPWLSAAEMLRVLKPGGQLVVTAPGFGWPRHDFPGDLWRFSGEAFGVLFRFGEAVAVERLEEADDGDGPDTRLWAKRL